jgi:hypothetical protein
MIYLIEYDRPNGRIVTFEKFDDTERVKAETARLHLDLKLSHNSVEHEVVLLEADNEEALRRTHRRYFEDISQIINSVDGHNQ